jgi:Protein of unknown function (DUF3574)
MTGFMRLHWNYHDPMMKPRYILPFIALVLFSLAVFHRRLSSKTQPQTTPTLQGDPLHPPQTQGWIETRLYFGLGPADEPTKGSSEAQWRDFLDHEVTPRFPSGLSVVDVYGQWQGQQQSTPSRIRTKMLIIDHPSTTEDTAKLEAIRTAWKQRTHEHSVLEVSEPAEVSF